MYILTLTEPTEYNTNDTIVNPYYIFEWDDDDMTSKLIWYIIETRNKDLINNVEYVIYEQDSMSFSIKIKKYLKNLW